MIRIPTYPAPQPLQAEPNAAGASGQGAFSDPRRDPFKRRGERDGALRDGALRDGLARDLGHPDRDDLRDRSDLFSRRVQEALGEGRSEDRRREGAVRVLATAEAEAQPPAGALPAPVPPAAALPAAAPGAAPADASPPGSAETIVADLAARIEQAFRQDLSASAGGTVALRVAPGDTVAGIRDITVAVGPAGLDVTLNRGSGEAPPDLVEAARLLAQRLQARFGRRVRILDAAAEEAQGSGGTLGEIGRLLGGARS